MKITINGSARDMTDAEKADVRTTIGLGPLSTMTVAEAQASLSGDGKGTLVIIGSSGAAGMGSSGYTSDPGSGGAQSATSWSGLWAAELAAKGVTTYNVSISGTNSTNSLTRFAADVAAKLPTHVAICTSPTNEGFNAAPQSSSLTYVANCLRLAHMTQNIGAVPIMGLGVYPNSTWTATHLACARWILRQFELAGLPTVNLIDPLLSGTGAVLAGFASDGQHFQDVGQVALFSAIPPHLVVAAKVGLPYPITYDKTARLGAGATTAAPLTCQLARPCESYTFAARIKGDAAITGARSFMFIGDSANGRVRLRNPSGLYELAEADGTALIASTVNPTSDTTSHTIVITKHRRRGQIKLFIDGEQIGSTVTASAALEADVTRFDVLGRFDSPSTNAINAGVSAIGIWRCAFTDDVIAQISAGRWPSAGAEVLSHGYLDAPVCALPNYAQSLQTVKCNSASFTAV